MLTDAISRSLLNSLLHAALAILAAVEMPAQTGSAPIPSTIQANSNRMPAGKLERGVLALHLELRQGDWYPEADTGPSMKVYAFGEEGKPLQVPGPLIRVTEGTEIHLTMKNFLPTTAVVHGMHEHPGNIDDFVKVATREVRQVNFIAGSPGTYQYWATAGGDLFGGRPYKEDSQLVGAFIVDPQGAAVDDRVFVLGLWQAKPGDDSAHNVAVINGKSWPYTERLAYEPGKPVCWRLINGSHWPHPMHMHGSYYRVDSAGDGERDEIFSPAQRQIVVTRLMPPGTTMSTFWIPPPGRWIFHCHILRHILPDPSPSPLNSPELNFGGQGLHFVAFGSS
jgi:FtsP/CotA-like multicopper oxidase with cupredoxin domain